MNYYLVTTRKQLNKGITILSMLCEDEDADVSSYTRETARRAMKALQKAAAALLDYEILTEERR